MDVSTEGEDALGAETRRDQRRDARGSRSRQGVVLLRRGGVGGGRSSIRDDTQVGRMSSGPSLEAVEDRSLPEKKNSGGSRRASRGPERAIYGNGMAEPVWLMRCLIE